MDMIDMIVVEKELDMKPLECINCGISKDRCDVCKMLNEHRKRDMNEGRIFSETILSKKNIS